MPPLGFTIASLCALAIAALMLPAGCGTSGGNSVGTWSRGVQPSAQRAGAEAGFDFETWFVADPAKGASGPGLVSIAEAVAPYEGLPVPLVTGSRSIAGANGMRVVSIPTEMIAALRNGVALAGPVTRRGSGEMASWTPVIAGPPFEGPIRLGLDSGALRLADSGRMRLLARGWLAPLPEGLGGEGALVPEAAAMYLELVPQFVQEDAGREPEDALDAPPELDAKAPVEEGTPFPRLRMALMLRPGETVVVMLGRGLTASEDVGPGAEGEPVSEPIAAPMGPLIPADSSIGGLIFSDALVVPARGIETVLIVTARGPNEFRLNRRRE